MPKRRRKSGRACQGRPTNGTGDNEDGGGTVVKSGASKISKERGSEPIKDEAEADKVVKSGGSKVIKERGSEPIKDESDKFNEDGSDKVSKDASDGVVKDGGGEVAKGGGEVAKDGGGEVAKDGSDEVAKDGGGEVAKDGGGEVAKDGGGEVAKDGGDEVAKDGGDEVVEDGGDEVSQDEWEISIQDQGSNAVDNVPAEIWTRILSTLDFYPNVPLINKRLVCRAWRDVIDEHMVFQVTLNDQKTDVGTTMSHIRAKACVVFSLVKRIHPGQLILREPKQLKKLSLWGPISVTNMVYFARRFENVNNLHITGSAFAFGSPYANFLTPARERDSIILNNWLGRLIKLELSGIQWTPNARHNRNRSFRSLVRREMPMLRSLCMKLCVRSASFVPSINDVMFFIGRNPGINLLSLQIQSPDHPHNINAQLNEQYRGIQLETLRLDLDCPREFRLFMPLIEQQERLQELRVIFRVSWCTSLEPPEVTGYLGWDDMLQSLTNPIQRQTLVSLQILQFHIRTNLNMASFQGLRNLKKLVLSKSNMKPNSLSKAINLAQLPDSLEYLQLTNLTCGAHDLELLFNNTPNLKFLELNTVGQGVGIGFYQYHLQSLMRKKKMKTISLKHVDLSRFDVQTLNGKTYVILDEFKIHIKSFCSHDFGCCSLDVEFDKKIDVLKNCFLK